MNYQRNLLVLLIATACLSCSAATPSTTPGKAAQTLNAQSKTSLGVGIRALAFLFEAEPGTYLAKRSVSLQANWHHLVALKKAGYVEIHTVPSAEGDLVQIVLTDKGQAVVSELQGP